MSRMSDLDPGDSDLRLPTPCPQLSHRRCAVIQAAATVDLRPVFDQLWLLRKTHHRLQGEPARCRPGGALTCIGASPLDCRHMTALRITMKRSLPLVLCSSLSRSISVLAAFIAYTKPV